MRLSFQQIKNSNYLVHGIQRGGNHAIINWILYHFESFLFYNCCSLSEGHVFLHESDLFKKCELDSCRGISSCTIASFEDCPEKITESRKIFREAKCIIIIRDFYNTYASRFEKMKQVKSISSLQKKWKLYDDVNKWKDLAKFFLEKQEDVIKINYNLWVLSKEYRRLVSNNFGNFTDLGFEQVPQFAGGSSFDQMKYDKKASEMKVLERWKKYYKDKEYIEKILSDKEARELNMKIFGDIVPKIFN